MVRKEKREARWQSKRKQIGNIVQLNQVSVQNKDPNLLGESWLLQQIECNQIEEERKKKKEEAQKEVQQVRDKQSFSVRVEQNISNQFSSNDFIPKKPEQSIMQPDTQQNNSCSKEEYELIIKQINNQTFCDRHKEIQAIKQFLSAPLADVLYICGSTGTGKTTTVLRTLQSASLKYTLINCLNYPREKNGRDYLKCLQSVEGQGEIKTNEVIVIDECEFSTEISRDIQIIRQSIVNQKIILICNNRPNEFAGGQQFMSNLLFLPYSQIQAIQIAKLKLLQTSRKIPDIIFLQGAKKTNKSGGDFRQMQKHIAEWAYGQLKNQGSPQNFDRPFRLTNPSIQMLQSYLKSNMKKKNLLLGLIVEIASKEQRKDRNQCACNRSIVSNLMKKSGWRKMQLQHCLKQFEQMGLIKIVKGRCHWHSKLIPLMKINLKRNQNELKDVLMKNGYLN